MGVTLSKLVTDNGKQLCFPYDNLTIPLERYPTDQRNILFHALLYNN